MKINSYFPYLESLNQQYFAQDSILTITTNGQSLFLNGYANHTRNHNKNISKNEYISRIIVRSVNICNILKNKFRTVGHSMIKIDENNHLTVTF